MASKVLDNRIYPQVLPTDFVIKSMEKNILLGFPRSGNTAIRLFLERYTMRPTGRPLIINGMVLGVDTRSSILFSDRTMAEMYNETIPLLVKIHKLWEIDMLPGDKVIYILRDYKDCIPGILKFDDKIFSEWYSKQNYNNDCYGYKTYDEFINTLIDYSYNYGEQLKQFYFLENKKMLVYYEDFITSFESVAEQILKFLDIEIIEERINLCNPINKQGRYDTDKHFERTGRDNKQINVGHMNFVGEYKNILKERDLKILRTLFKKQLGENIYKELLGRYD